MDHDVHIEQVAAQPLAVVRRRARLEELAVVVPEACGVVWQFVRASGVKQAGRHVAVYLDTAGNIEVGVEVNEAFTPGGEVVASATPAGPVATAAHVGPYQRLGETHRAIRQWCADQRLTLAGPSWEVYGHWTDDPTKLRTDVFYLLAPLGPPSAA